MLGSPFLNDYYQVYDMTRNQIGLVRSIYMTNDQTTEIDSPVNVDIKWTKFIVIMFSSLTFTSSFLIRIFYGF